MKLVCALVFVSLSCVNSKMIAIPYPRQKHVREHPSNPSDQLRVIIPEAPSDTYGDIFLDDVILTGMSEHHRSKRVALNHESVLWTGGIVPYRLDSTLSSDELTAINDGIEHIEYHTCVDFYNIDTEGNSYNPTFNNSLFFTTGNGCFSSVGRRKVIQPIQACGDLITATHEMLHALGLYHEHNHRDRDDFVQIRFDNVIEDEVYFYQFEVRDAEYVLAGSYSPSSLMHYSPYTFSKNNYRTIAPLDEYFTTWHTDTWDAYKQINQLYTCDAGCSGSVNCQHGGYPFKFGSDCTCVCVDWLNEASQCSDFDTGVVGTFLDITTDTTTISLNTLSQGNVQPGTTYMWVLEAPEGYNLLVDFTEVEVAEDMDGCVSLLTIKRRNLGTTDKMFCGNQYRGTIFSHKNIIALILEVESVNDVLEAVVTRKHESDWCYNVADKGATYNGEMNRAADNSPCLNWAQTSECEHSPLKSGDLKGDYSGNACRNPGGQRARPWCFVNMDDGGCDIKYCDACGYGEIYDTYYNCNERLINETSLCDTQDGLFGCRKTCNDVHVAVTSADSCPAPGAITGSTFNGDLASSYPIGSQVTYTCNDDLTITGNRFCLSTGDWSTLNAVCGGEIEDEATNCATLALDPDYCSSPAGLSDCARTCQHETTCAFPEPSSEERSERITGATLGAGQTGEYRCLSDFVKLMGDEQRTCRADGTLTGDPLYCTVGALRQSATCDVTDPATSDHVTCFQTGSIESGLTLECHCEQGYTQVSGDRLRMCFDGVLAGQQPVCQEITCDTTTGVNVNNLGTGSTIGPGSAVTYECIEGYLPLVGDLTRTCTVSGILDGHPPICAEMFCNVELTAPGSNALRQSNSIVKVGQVAHYACLSGYERTSGDLQRTCNGDLALSGSLPSCLAIQCSVDQPPAGNLVTLTSASLLPVGVSATYECTSGQLVEGTLERQCQADGTLSGSLPRCSDNECLVPDLTGSNVQRLSPSSVGANQDAEYRCLPGYALVSGNLVRACGASGSLTGSAPQCAETAVCVDQRGDCGAILNFLPDMCSSIQDFANGCPATCGNCFHHDTFCEVAAPETGDGVSVMDGLTPRYPGQVVSYQCDQDTWLVTGDLVRACRLDGSLTGKPPACSDVTFAPRWLNSLGRMRTEQANPGKRAIFGPSEYTTIPFDGLLTCWRFYCHAFGRVRFVVIRIPENNPENYYVVGHNDYLCHEDTKSTYCPETPIQVQEWDFIGFVDIDGGNTYYDPSLDLLHGYSELRISWLADNIFAGNNQMVYEPLQFPWIYSVNALITPDNSP